MKNILIELIVLYQRYISPYTAPRCRFYPTCSEYAKHCFINYGVFKGGLLAAARLCRCNPLFGAGVDLAPEGKQKKG